MFSSATFFLAVALTGSATADMQLGIQAFKDEDYVQAAMEFTIDARQGNSQAQVNLGLLYENGLGVERDATEAFKWYETAARSDNVLAQINLAALYFEGIGIDQNDAKAAHWYHRAAMRGNATAQYNLAIMFEGGQGVELDLVQAWAWLELAARQDADVLEWERTALTEKLTADEVQAAQALLKHYQIRYEHVD